MILFLNVGLFDQRLGPTQNRENAKQYDKIDVFKYCLASYVYFHKWSKVIIYYQLGDEYKEREQELQLFIEKEFKDFNLITRNYRNELPSQWRETYELFDDNLILYNCNHDHVFLDPDPNYITEITKDFQNSNDLISISWSHWPEYLSNTWSTYRLQFTAEDIQIHDKYVTYKIGNDINSLNIITKQTYHYWWFTYELPEKNFMRPDHFTDPIWHYGNFEKHTTVVPYRELGRHFDGYQHCAWKYLNAFCPVLEIPEGFFDNEIRINYSPKYIEGMTNINPMNDKLRLFDQKGSDFNMHKDFIPIFWQKRISEFKYDYNMLDGNDTNLTLKEVYVDRVINTWCGLPRTNFDTYNHMMNKVRKHLQLI